MIPARDVRPTANAMLGSQEKGVFVQPRAGRGNRERTPRHPKSTGDKVTARNPAATPAWRVSGAPCTEVKPLPGAVQVTAHPSRERCGRERGDARGRRAQGRGQSPGAEQTESPGRPTLSLKAQTTPTILVKRSTAPVGPLSRDGTAHTPPTQTHPCMSPHSGATETHTKAALWFHLFYAEIHMG